MTSSALTQAEIEKVAEDNPKLRPHELEAFVAFAARHGMDPLRGECTARVSEWDGKRSVKFGLGVDGLRKVAARTGQYAGVDDAVYEGSGERPELARVTVYRLVRGVRCPFTASARWKEYCPGGNAARMWTKMPFLMLGKAAESLALRKAFPCEVGAFEADDTEMGALQATPTTIEPAGVEQVTAAPAQAPETRPETRPEIPPGADVHLGRLLLALRALEPGRWKDRGQEHAWDVVVKKAKAQGREATAEFASEIAQAADARLDAMDAQAHAAATSATPPGRNGSSIDGFPRPPKGARGGAVDV